MQCVAGALFTGFPLWKRPSIGRVPTCVMMMIIDINRQAKKKRNKNNNKKKEKYSY